MMARFLIFPLLLAWTCWTSGAESPAESSRLVTRHGLTVRVDGEVTSVWRELRSVVDLQLTLVSDTVATPPLADDLAFFVRKELLALGYAAAEVTWSLENSTAVLQVTPGERERIGRTIFRGTEAATEEEMRAMLLRPTRERYGRLGREAPLVESEIRAGAALVQRLIQSKGFLGATVNEPEFVRRPGEPTEIVLAVKEGTRTVFGSVSLSGEFPGSSAALQADARKLTAQPFSEVKAEAFRTSLLSSLQSSGHFGATVETSLQPDAAGSKVDVLYRIEPGGVFRIRRLDVGEEFSRGAQRIIHAGFRPAEGQVWSLSDLELMQRRVMDAGLLATMDVEPQRIPGDAIGLALRISGTESPRRTLALYGGYETLRGPILGLEWRHVNVLDTGDTMRLRAGWEAGGPEGSLRWIHPALFASAWSLDTELAALHATAWNYTHDSIRLRAAVSRQYGRRLAVSFFGSVSADSAGGGGLTEEELGPSQYQTASGGGLVSLDFRDSPLVPHKGWFTSAELEAGNAAVPFVRGRVRFSWYQPINDKLRVAANWQAGAVSVRDGIRRLPLDQRMFNGGASTVRSFGERALGPQSQGGTPLGGSLMQAANAEISWEFLPNLEAALFADAGSLSQSTNPFPDFPDDLRYAIGLGLRYALPVGPLRLDYGLNPDRREGEPSGAFHATFGYAF